MTEPLPPEERMRRSLLEVIDYTLRSARELGVSFSEADARKLREGLGLGERPQPRPDPPEDDPISGDVAGWRR